MRFFTVAILVFGMAQSGFAITPGALASKSGSEVVIGLRAMAENAGLITSEAALTRATGNPAIGAMFTEINAAYQAQLAGGKVIQVTNWEELADKSKNLTAEQTIKRFNTIAKSGKGFNQQTVMTALSVPVSRKVDSKLTQEVARASASSAYTSATCPPDAVQCKALFQQIEASKNGAQGAKMSPAEAETAAKQFGMFASLIQANAANCGEGALGKQCMADLQDGAAGLVTIFGSRLNEAFMVAAIESSATEKSDFTAFKGKNAPIAEGIRRAASLGEEGMGAELPVCFTQGGLN